MGPSAAVFVFAALFSVASCQVADDCATVDEGIRPLLVAPCVASVETCVTATPDRNLTFLSGVFCIAQAQSQYDNFLRCTNQTFTDRVFGGVCGGPGCTSDPFTSCAPPEGDRCYNVAVRNNATAAFEACLCSNDTQSSSQPECPAECSGALQELVDDVGCCVNTVIYAYYFSTCGDQDLDASLSVINNLFESCSLTLPDSCLHPFNTDSVDDGSKMLTSDLVSIVVSLGMLFYLVV